MVLSQAEKYENRLKKQIEEYEIKDKAQRKQDRLLNDRNNLMNERERKQDERELRIKEAEQRVKENFDACSDWCDCLKKKRDQLFEKDQELSEKEKKLSQLSSDSKKSENDNTLDDVDEFDEQIKQNFSDCAPISNIENDPATSKNSFNSHYEPIRPMIEFPISFEGATNRKIVFKSSWYDMYAWLEQK